MAQFQVKIIPGLTAADTRAEVIGKIPAPAKALDKYAWGAAVGQAIGSPYLYGQIPLVDMSKVTAHVVAAKVTVAPPDITPKALAHKLWDNTDNDEPAHYEASLTAGVRSSDSVSWSRSASRTWTATVGVEVGGGPVKGSASSSYSYGVAVGKATSHSVEHAIDSTDSVSEEVDPHSAAVAVLLVQSGSVDISIDFHVEFKGGPIPYATQYFGKRIDGPHGSVSLAKALPHLARYYVMQNTMRQSIDFYRDTESKIVSITDNSDKSVHAGIQQALDESRVGLPPETFLGAAAEANVNDWRSDWERAIASVHRLESKLKTTSENLEASNRVIDELLTWLRYASQGGK